MKVQTNINELTIISNRKAPVCQHSQSGTSKWKDLFESMKLGDWILVKDKHTYANIKRAATIHLRGRYRCYINPESKGTWVFTKYK